MGELFKNPLTLIIAVIAVIGILGILFVLGIVLVPILLVFIMPVSSSTQSPDTSYSYDAPHKMYQVGVEIKRVDQDNIRVKMMSGNDIVSLESIRVMVNGAEVKAVSGGVTNSIGTSADYPVTGSADISVIGIFTGDQEQMLWTGMIA